VSVHYVYVLESRRTGRYYIGSTHDVEKRLAQHNAGRTKSTRNLRPWNILHVEIFTTKPEAARRERLIKSWKSRKHMKRQFNL